MGKRFEGNWKALDELRSFASMRNAIFPGLLIFEPIKKCAGVNTNEIKTLLFATAANTDGPVARYKYRRSRLSLESSEKKKQVNEGSFVLFYGSGMSIDL